MTKKTKRLRFWLLLVLVVVGLGSTAGGLLLTCDWGGALLNLGTEMLGAVATYYVFDLIIRRSEEQEEEKEDLAALKADLIARMGSQVNDVAVAAAEELRRRGWLCDASLRGMDLQGANLEGADLQEVDMRRADLRGANLVGVNLQSANLEGADLRGVSLRLAELHNANLQGVTADSTTLLPHGGKGGEDIDWARFTDPGRPDFGHKKKVEIF